MKEGAIDKRIVKTKAAIRSALKKLVQEKDLSEISITELTNEAQITRSTFYMYYNEVSDVRDDIENAIVERLGQIMTDTDLAMVFINPYPFLSTIANEIVKYDENNKYILSEKNSGHLLEKLSQMMTNKFVSFLESTGQGDVAKAKYIAIFFSSGIFECFKMWYNHQSSLSLEDLCKKMSNFIKKGLAMASTNDGEI